MSKKEKKAKTEGQAVTRTKDGKFQELATKRVSAALTKIRLIGNLSNRASYDYSLEQVKYIFTTLKDALEAVEEKFSVKEEVKAAQSFSVPSKAELSNHA